MRDINNHNQKILDQLIIPSKVPDICNSMIGNIYMEDYILNLMLDIRRKVIRNPALYGVNVNAEVIY